ncbi:MAG TPA: acyl carrier protein [Gammaproteobacteria bacterium]|nr:acyl carrier protein [Gammaproteobacteria bacterium]
MVVLENIRQILGDVLQIDSGSRELTESTPLLGNLPELDSMAVVSLITSIEEFYGFEIDDEEINAEVFETVGSLAEFIKGKI